MTNSSHSRELGLDSADFAGDRDRFTIDYSHARFGAILATPQAAPLAQNHRKLIKLARLRLEAGHAFPISCSGARERGLWAGREPLAVVCAQSSKDNLPIYADCMDPGPG